MKNKTTPTVTETEDDRSRIGLVLAVVFATVVGAFPRLVGALSSSFPLNDGGLFYVMTKDLEAANYILPLYTSYNSAHIPFAYPPLSFFLASALTRLFRWPLLDLVRVLPPVVSVLTVPVFFFLSRSILRNKYQAIYATFAFATFPTAFDWLIMGGGLARGPGFLFALLAVLQVYSIYNDGRARFIFTAIIFASLTILTHLGMAWFVACASVILFIFYGRTRRSLYHSVWVAAGTVILTAPWWLTIIVHHGLAPLMSASGTSLFSGSAWAFAFLFIFTNEPILGLLAVLGLLGVFICIRDRKWLLPVWLISIFFLQTRLSPTYAVVPFAMLVGVCIDQVLLPALNTINPRHQSKQMTGEKTPVAQGKMLSMSLPNSLAAQLALGYILLFSMLSSYIAAPKEALSHGQIDAMQWVADHTAEGSSFAIITGISDSGVDAVSEWFPTLAHRVSLATPQGYEWLPGKVFDLRRQLHSDLQACATRKEYCLETWADSAGLPLQYIYLSERFASPNQPDGNSVLLESLDSSPAYILIYDKPGTKIFARR